MSSEETVAGWLVHRHWRVSSTNDLAKSLRPWEAVVASVQDAGRGRHGRAFSSGEGGLWLSAVVPMPGGAPAWSGFALVVGWAVLAWLRALGLDGARLRWPNDILVRDRKLAGLLLEQSSPDRCVVGIGLNLVNCPWEDDPELAATATRLADEISPCPPIDQALEAILNATRSAQNEMLEKKLPELLGEINSCWHGPRAVELLLCDGTRVAGSFFEIDGEGRLILRGEGGGHRAFPAHHVTRLVEV